MIATSGRDCVPGPWAGKVLHVDLATREIDTFPIIEYVGEYLGGRGLAVRLAWDLLPRRGDALDANNVLFFTVGALVGTSAPSSGRVTVSGKSPQAYPHQWYTRANLGGHWGPALKYAGYDGIVVTGRAKHPTVLLIDDDRVSLRDAEDLWGMGLIAAQRQLVSELGKGWRALAIGPAGENLCRYAIVATGTESAAGQGGFGAVMGSKNLKAIAVRGTGAIAVAEPRELLRRSGLVARRAQQRYGALPSRYADASEGFGTSRPAPCTATCPRSCGTFYSNVQGTIHPKREYSGQVFCCAPRFRGGDWLGSQFSPHEAFELAQISNELGLNHWEITFGLVPWLLRVREEHDLGSLGIPSLHLDDPAFWAQMMEDISARRGWGDLMAEGGPRLADALGVGHDIVTEFYPAWGQASHWDGHGSFPSPYFPYWLVTALQWAMDSRDPIGGGHGYTTNVYGLLRTLDPALDDEVLRAKLDHVGEMLYGSRLAVDPRSGYGDKEIPAVAHGDSGALKDSLGICDNIFPMLTDPKAEDLLVQVDGVCGQNLEHWLFEVASDVSISRDGFYRCGARILTLERLLAIRHWGRDRRTDETILAYLRHPEGSENPYRGQREPFDEGRFRQLMDAYYRLRGWDAQTAAPLPSTLRDLGLTDLVSDAMTPGVEG